MSAMTERDLQASVRQVARMGGWLAYHTHDSRRSDPGFPDLVLVHRDTGRLIFAELKSPKGRMREEQVRWLNALGRRHETYLWRPADWLSGEIRRVLLGERQAAAS